jgi:hypothetical protein
MYPCCASAFQIALKALGRKLAYSRAVAPAVIEVEQAAYGYGVLDSVISPAGVFQCIDIFLALRKAYGIERHASDLHVVT